MSVDQKKSISSFLRIEFKTLLGNGTIKTAMLAKLLAGVPIILHNNSLNAKMKT